MTNISKYLGIAAVLAGCATATPAPTEQMALSKAAVANAVSAGAPEFAAPDMSSAQDKLARATVAMTAENYDIARMLAEQAQVEAELAAAKARSAKAQKAAHAVEEDSRVLREELNRKSK